MKIHARQTHLTHYSIHTLYKYIHTWKLQFSLRNHIWVIEIVHYPDVMRLPYLVYTCNTKTRSTKFGIYYIDAATAALS